MGRASPDASEPGNVSVKLPGSPGATITSVPTAPQGPSSPARRQTRVATSALIAVLSVLRFGIVQVSATLSPFRVADQSPTGSARFSDGGCGAAGVPHPDSDAHKIPA